MDIVNAAVIKNEVIDGRRKNYHLRGSHGALGNGGRTKPENVETIVCNNIGASLKING